jgi:hypothetical protein
MTPHVESLWPTDFGNVNQETPLAILRQQGFALGQVTKNIVVGRVTTEGSGGRFLHRFHLYCSALSYETELFTVDHGIELYPAQLVAYTGGLRVGSPDELKNELKRLFATEKTRQLIATLMAQSKE